jgi:hypothetical protein
MLPIVMLQAYFQADKRSGTKPKRSYRRRIPADDFSARGTV